MKSIPKVNNNPVAGVITQKDKLTVPDTIIKKKAPLIGGADKAAKKTYNFHNHPGN